MRRRLFGVCACTIAAAIILGQSGCASSNKMASVTAWEGGNSARLTQIDLDRRVFGFAAAEEFIWLAPDQGVWIDPTNSVLKFDPRTLEIIATIPVSRLHAIITLVVGEGAVWAPGDGSLFSHPTLFRIDPATNQVVAEIPLDGYSEGIAIGEGAVWVGTGGTVTRIDPKTNAVVARIPVGRDTWDRISVGAGAIWVLKMMDAMVYRIDPATNQVVAAISVGPSKEERRRGSGGFSLQYLLAVLAGPGALPLLLAAPFIPDETGYSQLHMPPFPSLTASAEAVWVTEALDWTTTTPSTQWHVLRIDPVTNQVVAKIPLQGKPYSVTSYQGFLWVSMPCYLVKVDPQRDAVIDRLAFTSKPYCSIHDGVQLGGGSNAIWALKPARPDDPLGTDARLLRIEVTTD